MTRLAPNLMPVVLALEDSDEDFDTMQEAIRKSGQAAELRRVTTADACIQILYAQCCEPVCPALVLLDLNTPATDGCETLEVIKSAPALKDLVIVVLTMSANPKDLAFCYEVGANAYHVRPLRYTEHLGVLLDVFNYWLTRVALPQRRRLIS